MCRSSSRFYALIFCVLSCIFLAFFSNAWSQTIERELMSAGGESQQVEVNDTSVIWTWTMGETLTESYTGSKKRWTQGFVQGIGFVKDTVGIDTTQDVSIEGAASMAKIVIFFYPNPTSGPLYLQLTAVENACVWASSDVKDARGRLLQSLPFREVPLKEEINLSSYAPGVYLLTVYFKVTVEGKIYKKVYKIIKK